MVQNWLDGTVPTVFSEVVDDNALQFRLRLICRLLGLQLETKVLHTAGHVEGD